MYERCNDMKLRDPELLHMYANADGVMVPSVTHIINIKSKPALVSMANAIGKYQNWDIKEFMSKKALLGTQVHKLIELFLKNELEGYEVQEQYPGFVKQSMIRFNNFKKWFEMLEPELIESELQLAGKEYGGTLDSIFKFKTGQVALIDFKTSRNFSDSHYIQLGGYLQLMKELRPDLYDRIDIAGILLVGDNKTFRGCKLKYFDKEHMQSYIEVFKNTYILFKSWLPIARDDWRIDIRDLGIYENEEAYIHD